MKQNILESVTPAIKKIVEDNNLHLYDIEYVKEDEMWFLRVSIEKDDGSMDFETAEIISNLVSEKLDELDPIDNPYVLDVCSPGIERPLKSIEDFKKNLGNYIYVELKEVDSNEKDSYSGDLKEVDDEFIKLSYKEKTRNKEVCIKINNIKKANIAIKF